MHLRELSKFPGARGNTEFTWSGQTWILVGHRPPHTAEPRRGRSTVWAVQVTPGFHLGLNGRPSIPVSSGGSALPGPLGPGGSECDGRPRHMVRDRLLGSPLPVPRNSVPVATPPPSANGIVRLDTLRLEATAAGCLHRQMSRGCIHRAHTEVLRVLKAGA